MGETIYNDGKDFLQKARDRFKYCMEAWKDIRAEHNQDMLFLAGQSWDPTEARRRKDKNIPMPHLDELTQYINQLVNDIRQNKRAVNVLPKGSGANDQTASLRADWIRSIEYISQAQTAYVTAFEGQCGGSYGFCKLETYYDSQKSFNQSARIVPIVNANTIIYDPDCKQYDCSDAADCWEIDFISHDEFKRRYPDAEIKTFTDEIQRVDTDSYWLKKNMVQLASWWKVEITKIKLHLVKTKDGSAVMRSDQLPEKLDKKDILQTRDYDDRRVVQYVLNGVEVLETNDPKNGKGWPGQWIPIIPFWGKELFIDEGSGSKRMLMSLIRLARFPQRALNYAAAQEMMEMKMTPRSPYTGPVGMFSANPDDWAALNEDPKAFIEWTNPEGFQPGSIEPKRIPFAPNFQQYELVKESYRRAIMTSMGISPLPTAAQRGTEKSGVALKRIQGERAQGSYHFVDNFDRSIVFLGKQLDDLYDRIVDTPRDIPARKEDGTNYMARVKDKGHAKNKEDAGDHDVTIIVGPSDSSQREEAAEFADTIAQIPGVFPLIGDLIVRLRNLGPIGQQIAERLTPPQFAGQDDSIPPTAKAAMAQMQQQAQQLHQVIQQLQMEKAAKVVEKESAYRIAALQENTKLVVAQATLQRDQAESILQNELQKIQTILGQAHDQATQAADHAHDHLLADHQAQLDQQQASHEASLVPQQAEPAGASSSNGNGGNAQ